MSTSGWRVEGRAASCMGHRGVLLLQEGQASWHHSSSTAAAAGNGPRRAVCGAPWLRQQPMGAVSAPALCCLALPSSLLPRIEPLRYPHSRSSASNLLAPHWRTAWLIVLLGPCMLGACSLPPSPSADCFLPGLHLSSVLANDMLHLLNRRNENRNTELGRLLGLLRAAALGLPAGEAPSLLMPPLSSGRSCKPSAAAATAGLPTAMQLSRLNCPALAPHTAGNIGQGGADAKAWLAEQGKAGGTA